MKRYFLFLTAVVVIFVTSVVLYSCSADDDEYDDLDLRIEKQVTRVKLSAAESGTSGGKSHQNYRDNECGLYCITSMLGNPDEPFYYNKVYAYASQAGWDSDSGRGLTNSQIIKVCDLLRADSYFQRGKNVKYIENLPTVSCADPEEAQEILRDKSSSFKATDKITVGVVITVRTRDEDTGKDVVKDVNHWVNVEKIVGNTVYVKNPTVSVDGRTKKVFSLSEIKAVCY